LNSKLAKVRNHGHVELKGQYHERVRILNILKEQIWRQNIVEMKVQIVVNVVPIYVILVPSLLHQNYIGVTYVGTSNFGMEPIRFVPLYFMGAMSKFIVIVTEGLFVSAPIQIIDVVKSRTQTPKAT